MGTEAPGHAAPQDGVIPPFSLLPPKALRVIGVCRCGRVGAIGVLSRLSIGPGERASGSLVGRGGQVEHELLSSCHPFDEEPDE